MVERPSLGGQGSLLWQSHLPSTPQPEAGGMRAKPALWPRRNALPLPETRRLCLEALRTRPGSAGLTDPGATSVEAAGADATTKNFEMPMKLRSHNGIRAGFGFSWAALLGPRKGSHNLWTWFLEYGLWGSREGSRR